MDWIKLSSAKPAHKQTCMVKTVVQLDLFLDKETCETNSIFCAVYDANKDEFLDMKTNTKISNPKCWSPL